MLESTEIGDDNDVLTDIIGVPSELNPDASKYGFPVNNNVVIATIEQIYRHGLSKLIGKQAAKVCLIY